MHATITEPIRRIGSDAIRIPRVDKRADYTYIQNGTKNHPPARSGIPKVTTLAYQVDHPLTREYERHEDQRLQLRKRQAEKIASIEEQPEGQKQDETTETHSGQHQSSECASDRASVKRIRDRSQSTLSRSRW